jgi:hypothetical protein
MGKLKTPSRDRFTVDLGRIHLTNKEVKDLQNRITRLAVASVRTAKKKRPKEPYVKIAFVKTTHVRSP